MLPEVMAGLRWNASLGAKFFRVVPFFTLVIVLLTLVSQVAMLVASVLPLKVIIMLGSEGVPSYFPGFLAGFGRSLIIGILSCGTVGFFVLHLVCERMIGLATGRATTRLLAKSQKMVLFEGQEELAASSYQRYSRALAGGVFTGIAILGLGWFYPDMSLLMLGYFVLILLLLWQGVNHSSSVRERVETKLAQLMNEAALTGFFVAFAYMVCDFLFLNPPSVIIALIAFLLIRQAMQRAASMVTDLTLLYRQQSKLNSLFFHGQVFQPMQADSKNSPWSLLMPDSGEEWIIEVLNAVTGKESSESIEIYWHQLGNPNLVGVRVVREEQQFLLKLYEPNRSALALHEADLMMDLSRHLPCANWLGTVPVNKLHCLVYQLPVGERPKIVGTHPQVLRTALLATCPKPEVVQRYLRSKAVLWQRLNKNMLVRLHVAVTNIDQNQTLSLLSSKLPLLKQLLENLPLAVVNIEISQDTIWLTTLSEQGIDEPILLNWGSWSLEPIGFGWPETDAHLRQLADALATAAAKRPELTKVDIVQVELAALTFALEREYIRQRYIQALELIPRILDRMALLEKTGSGKSVNAG